METAFLTPIFELYFLQQQIQILPNIVAFLGSKAEPALTLFISAYPAVLTLQAEPIANFSKCPVSAVLYKCLAVSGTLLSARGQQGSICFLLLLLLLFFFLLSCSEHRAPFNFQSTVACSRHSSQKKSARNSLRSERLEQAKGTALPVIYKTF